MAGALAGAFYGMEDFPEYLYKSCEAHNRTQIYANSLHDLLLMNQMGLEDSV